MLVIGPQRSLKEIILCESTHFYHNYFPYGIELLESEIGYRDGKGHSYMSFGLRQLMTTISVLLLTISFDHNYFLYGIDFLLRNWI